MSQVRTKEKALFDKADGNAKDAMEGLRLALQVLLDPKRVWALGLATAAAQRIISCKEVNRIPIILYNYRCIVADVAARTLPRTYWNSVCSYVYPYV